jgi:hypothetical protein
LRGGEALDAQGVSGRGNEQLYRVQTRVVELLLEDVVPGAGLVSFRENASLGDADLHVQHRVQQGGKNGADDEEHDHRTAHHQLRAASPEPGPRGVEGAAAKSEGVHPVAQDTEGCR